MRAIYHVPTPNSSGFTYVVPAGPTRIVKSINCLFTTTATVGARFLFVQIVNKEGALLCSCQAQLTQAASLAGYYTWSPAMSVGVSDSPVGSCIPEGMELVEGDVVTITEKYAIDALDRLSACSLLCDVRD